VDISLSTNKTGMAQFFGSEVEGCALREGDEYPWNQEALTVHQLFFKTLNNKNVYLGRALAYKKGEEWSFYSYQEYYHLCRIAAKAMIHVLFLL